MRWFRRIISGLFQAGRARPPAPAALPFGECSAWEYAEKRSAYKIPRCPAFPPPGRSLSRQSGGFPRPGRTDCQPLFGKPDPDLFAPFRHNVIGADRFPRGQDVQGKQHAGNQQKRRNADAQSVHQAENQAREQRQSAVNRQNLQIGSCRSAVSVTIFTKLFFGIVHIQRENLGSCSSVPRSSGAEMGPVGQKESSARSVSAAEGAPIRSTARRTVRILRGQTAGGQNDGRGIRHQAESSYPGFQYMPRFPGRKSSSGFFSFTNRSGYTRTKP